MAAVFLGYLGLLVSAVADAPVAFALILLATAAADQWLELQEPNLKALLRGAQFGISTRALVRVLALALLVSRHFTDWSTGSLVAVLLLTASIAAVGWAYLGLVYVHGHRSARPVQTRNLDLGELTDPPPPPALLIDSVGQRLVDLGLVPLALGAIGVSIDDLRAFVVAAIAYDAIVLAACGVMVFHVSRLLRRPSHATFAERALAHVRELEPEIVLYFSGPPDSAYQINMWLQTLAELPRRSLIMLRESYVLDSLGATELPVVCLPNAVTVMEARLTSVRVALYPSNTSKNIHMLREPGIKHVFIGHGDSDKVSSINPFAKVYDEVWVAGMAGRDRYARAQVGIRDEAIVEVGRPQLDTIARADGTKPTGPLTVLYAPTWEGWNDETFASSVIKMGPTLVAKLLSDPAVRVIYKPHPFTGRRDRRAYQAHARIVDQLARANRSGVVAPDGRLISIQHELSRPDLSPFEEQRLAAEWSANYWGRLPASQHVVVEGSRPTLYDCFNHADLMVADVSSVVSDFLATSKPYVCTNSRGAELSAFRRENPTAAAAYVLGPDCAELPQILDAVRADDPLAIPRHALREYLLGPDEPPSIVRWTRAVDSLVARSAAHRSGPAGVDDGATPLARDDQEGHEVPAERVE